MLLWQIAAYTHTNRYWAIHVFVGQGIEPWLTNADAGTRRPQVRTRPPIRQKNWKSLESYGTQVAVNQKAILRLEIELTRLLGLKLNNEEVVIAFVK